MSRGRTIRIMGDWYSNRKDAPSKPSFCHISFVKSVRTETMGGSMWRGLLKFFLPHEGLAQTGDMYRSTRNNRQRRARVLAMEWQGRRDTGNHRFGGCRAVWCVTLFPGTIRMRHRSVSWSYADCRYSSRANLIWAL